LSGYPSLPQIVGDDGEEVIAENVVKQSGGISGGAYSDRATFAAGVQFSISDPAYNTVGSRVLWALEQTSSCWAAALII
jgi:hypothetical protein